MNSNETFTLTNTQNYSLESLLPFYKTLFDPTENLFFSQTNEANNIKKVRIYQLIPAIMGTRILTPISIGLEKACVKHHRKNQLLMFIKP